MQKNTERVDFRFPLEIKELMKSSAEEKGLKPSEYVRNLIEQDVHSLTHEQQVQHALSENTFLNGLMTNTELPLKSRKIIAKEMRKYV